MKYYQTIAHYRGQIKHSKPYTIKGLIFNSIKLFWVINTSLASIINSYSSNNKYWNNFYK